MGLRKRAWSSAIKKANVSYKIVSTWMSWSNSVSLSLFWWGRDLPRMLESVLQETVRAFVCSATCTWGKIREIREKHLTLSWFLKSYLKVKEDWSMGGNDCIMFIGVMKPAYIASKHFLHFGNSVKRCMTSQSCANHLLRSKYPEMLTPKDL